MLGLLARLEGFCRDYRSYSLVSSIIAQASLVFMALAFVYELPRSLLPLLVTTYLSSIASLLYFSMSCLDKFVMLLVRYVGLDEWIPSTRKAIIIAILVPLVAGMILYERLKFLARLAGTKLESLAILLAPILPCWSWHVYWSYLDALVCKIWNIARRSSDILRDKPCIKYLIDIVVWSDLDTSPFNDESLSKQWSIKD